MRSAIATSKSSHASEPAVTHINYAHISFYGFQGRNISFLSNMSGLEGMEDDKEVTSVVKGCESEKEKGKR